MIQSACNAEHKHMLCSIFRRREAELFSHQEPGTGDEDAAAVGLSGLDEMLLYSHRLSSYFSRTEL